MKQPGLLPVGVIVLLVFASASWACQPAGGAMLWTMQALPLLLTLPGLWRGERRAQQWLGFVLLFIMLVNIVGAFNPLPMLRMLGIANSLLALALFGGLLYRMKAAQSAASAHKES